MTIIQVIIILVVVGLALWAINSFIPMDPRIKQILNVVVILAVVLWLLMGFLLPMAGLGGARVR